jgi:hypothetical protein
MNRSTVSRVDKPLINNSRDFVLTHRELIDVDPTTGTGFTLRDFVINPSNENLFPWGHGAGIMFDRYEYTYLRVHYRARVPATTAGFLRISMDTDTLDPHPTSMASLAVMMGSIESSNWNNFTFEVPRQMLRGKRYVGTTIPPVADLKTYHIGKLLIGLEGFTGMPGTFEVDYSVRLYEPTPVGEDSALITLVGNRTIAATSFEPLIAPFLSTTITGRLPLTVLPNISQHALTGAGNTDLSTYFKFADEWYGTITAVAESLAVNDFFNQEDIVGRLTGTKNLSNTPITHGSARPRATVAVHAQADDLFTFFGYNADALSQFTPNDFKFYMSPISQYTYESY